MPNASRPTGTSVRGGDGANGLLMSMIETTEQTGFFAGCPAGQRPAAGSTAAMADSGTDRLPPTNIRVRSASSSRVPG